MSARKNPPSFVLIEKDSGLVVYTKRATGMGNAAIDACVQQGRKLAEKTKKTYVVFLDIRGLQRGMTVNVPAVYALGITEEIRPGRESLKHCTLCGASYVGTQQMHKFECSAQGANNPGRVRRNIFTFNNPSGAPNMVWAAYLLISLNRIYRVRLSPRKISALPGWISIQTGTRLVIDALRQKFGTMDYNDPRVQTVIQHAKSMELVKNNPAPIRKNIFTFNNPRGGDNQVEAAARAAGLSVATWAPGDGVIRYRFFLAKRGEVHADYHQGDGIYTALGRKDALNFVRAFGLGKGPKANPLTRKESANLLSRARSVHQRSKSPTQTVAGRNYLRGVADGLNRAVDQYGPRGAQKAVSSMWARTAKLSVRCNPACTHAHGVCENPYARGRERRSYQEYLSRKQTEYGSKFDSSDLDPRFISYYENGKRIWVSDFGHVTSGTVGVTTGWRPVFLLISSSRAMGSSTTLTRKTKILGEVGSYKPKRGEYGQAIENPLLQTVFAANPPDAAAQKRMMVDFLKKEFRHLHSDINGPDGKFDIEGAIYWFANDYHGGGGSALYSILSTSKFSPGPSVRGPEEGLEKMMYEALEQKYGGKKNPPISITWNSMTRRQREALLEIVGYDRDYQGGMTFGSWSSLPAHAKRKLEAQWLDTTSSGGTTKRRRAPIAVNPLTRREAGQVLKQAHAELRHGAVFRPGHTRSSMAGQAFGRAQTVVKFGPRAARPAARKVIKRAMNQAGTVMSNPGVRLPKPGTRLTVAEALDLAQKLGNRELVKQCHAAMKLQKSANKSAKCVVWKVFPMGSSDKIDQVVALTHYGDSPETMYRPPNGSKKGPHMYRHKWGEGGGGKKTVPLLASPDGKMLMMPLEGRKVASDWLRH